jgi:arabinose-5-phosphate isomerase
LKKLLLPEGQLDGDAIVARGREVIRIEADALAELEAALDGQFVAACQAILETKRQLVVTGMGKSGHISRKVAATFAATGTPAVFIHPAEAAHGDLGMLVEGDVLLVLSNSGNTSELRAILSYARKLKVRIIGVASHSTSLVMDFADIGICLPNLREACTANVAPTTSTTLQLALGDALAMAVMDMRGVSTNRLRALHPGGSIGLQLTPIAEIMHGADRLPLVPADAGMADVISKMTSGGFGIAGVVDGQGDLAGIITDGDLRRHIAMLDSASAAEVMTPDPKTIPGDMLAADALLYLNDNQITSAFIVNRLDTARPHRPVGIVHIHDLLRFGLN